MATKPNVLVFGAVDVFTPMLAQLLIPPLPAVPLISHLRIVDKYSINPPTTFISRVLLETIRDRKNLIEYRQGNMSNIAVISKAFTDPAPNGQPYTHIIDISGEYIADRPFEIYVQNVFESSLLIARASASQLSRIPGSIKAHVRLAGPFYHHTRTNGRYKEEEEEGWRTGNARGVWWHEMLRAIGSIKGLPLVVVRCGLTYGDGVTKFETVGVILLGLVYKHLGEEMKLPWSPDLPRSCIHTLDVAGIIWKAAEWISTKSRSEAETLAGAALPPSRDASVTLANTPNAILESAGSVVMPVFNMVDQGNETQAKLGEVIARVYGIEVGFQEFMKGILGARKLEEVAEEANQVHMQAWTEIITTSKPPVPETPLSPYVPPSILQEHGCSMDGEKIERVLRYQYRYPQFDERAVRDYINWCRSEGIWPESSLYTVV